ncbi:hypothetical protein GRF59_16305 [Paenibacillus sp. HJL G12]|uniref:Uncharacterized protein n=1 Tax=Paenibacillus dendrobii TaxID=2691084 RepID=A0A7X3LJ23_9BACL|nr:hypothetical protein [Paenibacillus dendrobii]MWV45188.1 hypothetical protein [Paenibacillus dendrobii]
MEKEIELAIKRGHHVFVKSVDGSTLTGIPEQSSDPDKLKMRTPLGSFWIPMEEVSYVSRLIAFK